MADFKIKVLDMEGAFLEGTVSSLSHTHTQGECVVFKLLPGATEGRII